MVEPSEPHDVGPEVGQHRLGPHVVGQRVVVRRLVRGETGPTGGPALTDLLGTCLSWTAGPDGACVVRPEDGEPVRIALADIVSGKPVPPRPSHRLRVEPREAHLRAMALWPDLETRELGRWLLRRSPTATARRANSVLALEPPGVERAVDRVVDFYAGTTGRPIAAVLPGSPEEDLFRGHGWGLESADADTVFSLAGVAAARRRLRGVDTDGVEVVPEAPGLVRARIGDGAGDGARDGAGDAAWGHAAYDRDWVGFRGLEVDPGHRGRGLALRVMAALLEWGAEQGATTAYLQVLADNEPALGLYERLGFLEHHRYRYLAPG